MVPRLFYTLQSLKSLLNNMADIHVYNLVCYNINLPHLDKRAGPIILGKKNV